MKKALCVFFCLWITADFFGLFHLVQSQSIQPAPYIHANIISHFARKNNEHEPLINFIKQASLLSKLANKTDYNDTDISNQTKKFKLQHFDEIETPLDFIGIDELDDFSDDPKANEEDNKDGPSVFQRWKSEFDSTKWKNEFKKWKKEFDFKQWVTQLKKAVEIKKNFKRSFDVLREPLRKSFKKLDDLKNSKSTDHSPVANSKTRSSHSTFSSQSNVPVESAHKINDRIVQEIKSFMNKNVDHFNISISVFNATYLYPITIIVNIHNGTDPMEINKIVYVQDNTRIIHLIKFLIKDKLINEDNFYSHVSSFIIYHNRNGTHNNVIHPFNELHPVSESFYNYGIHQGSELKPTFLNQMLFVTKRKSDSEWGDESELPHLKKRGSIQARFDKDQFKSQLDASGLDLTDPAKKEKFINSLADGLQELGDRGGSTKKGIFQPLIEALSEPSELADAFNIYKDKRVYKKHYTELATKLVAEFGTALCNI